ncbi:MAG: Mur ligase family protein, partial [Candidatus Peregrinibacteria bacterium]|nr:Mur ligase family protein [Candidatus Peregrinibacteria bacterium]
MDEFRKAENWLNGLFSESDFFRKNKPPSLEITNQFLDYFNRPDKSFQYRVVVTGTAGKGTVCRTTEDILLRSGKKVATLISPHIQVVTERIRINGKLISTLDFAENIFKIKSAAESLDLKPTYYEAIVLAGILAAKKAGCEILICEVGMGGEFDGVNAVQGKRIAAMTFVGHDHMSILGPTLADVARTKAGIFTPDSILNLTYEKKYHHILEQVANSKVELIKGIKAKLNKKLSRKICEKILNSKEFKSQKVNMPARWEKIENVILDGAHSAPRFEYILPKIKKLTGHKVAIIAITQNHTPEDQNIILDEFDEIFFCDEVKFRKCHPASELIKKLGKG